MRFPESQQAHFLFEAILTFIVLFHTFSCFTLFFLGYIREAAKIDVGIARREPEAAAAVFGCFFIFSTVVVFTVVVVGHKVHGAHRALLDGFPLRLTPVAARAKHGQVGRGVAAAELQRPNVVNFEQAERPRLVEMHFNEPLASLAPAAAAEQKRMSPGGAPPLLRAPHYLTFTSMRSSHLHDFF